MTFSLLGRCPRTGRLGIAICSSSPAVAARCAHVRPRVGVAATQNVTDPRLGPALLDALERAGDAERALDHVVRSSPHAQHRQLGLLGVAGRPAAFTGRRALGRHGQLIGPDCLAAGNLLAAGRVLDALVERFATEPGEELAERLLAALRAGAEAGGEAGPVHAAGLLVAGEPAWPIVDLRVDWHDDPLAELDALWRLYRPQVDDYVARALDPEAAPGYGVPGESLS